MAFNEALADEVRQRLAGAEGLTEKKMFGGIAFLVNDAMCVGVNKDDLIIRCEKAETDTLLTRPGVREFDLSGGRPMAGWVLVGPEATATPEGLATWVAFALDHAAKAAQTAKPPARSRPRRT